MAGGVLLLGQDVDKNCGNPSTPAPECFGFEKLQSLSGKVGVIKVVNLTFFIIKVGGGDDLHVIFLCIKQLSF